MKENHKIKLFWQKFSNLIFILFILAALTFLLFSIYIDPFFLHDSVDVSQEDAGSELDCDQKQRKWTSFKSQVPEMCAMKDMDWP